MTAGDRRFEADNVVVATGAYQRPRVPAFAPELDPAIVQLHSSEYRNPSQLREGGALVVGAGNSGAEIALEASRGHRTWLSGRDPGHEPVRAGSGPFRFVAPLIWFVAMHVLTVKTPIGRKVRRTFRSRGLPLARLRRKDLTAAGIELVPRTAGVRDGAPVLEDGRALDVANVIWCTGFVPDFTWIDLPIFGEDGPSARAGGRGLRARAVLHRALLPVRVDLAADRGGRTGRRAHRRAHRIAPPNRPHAGRAPRCQTPLMEGAGGVRGAPRPGRSSLEISLGSGQHAASCLELRDLKEISRFRVLRCHPASPSPSMAGSQRPKRGARTRFHHSESPTAIATSNPPAPANHDAMSTCLFATVTWLGRSPSASCSWSALSAL